jgi:hypothetical protein
VPAEVNAAPGDMVAVNVEEAQLAKFAANQIPILRVSRITEVRSRALAGLGAAQ